MANGNRFSYSVKFVCGIQKDNPQDCPVVRPGAYATEINIHNFKDTDARIDKFVFPVVLDGQVVGREPDQVRPKVRDNIVLTPNTVTMDDCCRISKLLGIHPIPVLPLMIGFLEIVSSNELSVTVVYTASDPRSGISIDVQQVVGKIK